jgi:hypothetical protein
MHRKQKTCKEREKKKTSRERKQKAEDSRRITLNMRNMDRKK